MLKDFSEIVIDSNVRSGQPCLRGTRITVDDVVGFLATGMTISEILEDFPKLSEFSITQALGYAKSKE